MTSPTTRRSHRGPVVAVSLLVALALVLAGTVAWLALRPSSEAGNPSGGAARKGTDGKGTDGGGAGRAGPAPEPITPVTEKPGVDWSWHLTNGNMWSAQVRNDVVVVGFDKPERAVVRLDDEGQEMWRVNGRNGVAHISLDLERVYTIDEWGQPGFTVLDAGTGETLWSNNSLELAHTVDDAVLARTPVPVGIPWDDPSATMFDVAGERLWRSPGYHVGIDGKIIRVLGSRVSSVEPRTGETIWEVDTELAHRMRMRVQVADGMVVLLGDKEVVAIDVEFGSELWRMKARGLVHLEPFGLTHVALSPRLAEDSRSVTARIASRDGVVGKINWFPPDAFSTLWGSSITHAGRRHTVADHVIYDPGLHELAHVEGRAAEAGEGYYHYLDDRLSYHTIDGEEQWSLTTDDGEQIREVFGRDGRLLVVTESGVVSYQ